MTESSSFRVIIVGASVAGLTLAHCLDKAGIDYLVLEKHENVDHVSLGGFLSVQPNGAQVLSQLGLHETVAAAGETITVCHTGFPDGFGFSDHWPDRLHKRFGVPMTVIRRQELLHILYSSLKDHSKILMKRKVVRIGHTNSGISVWTADGSAYHGDTAVGTDGVHSVTRSEVWRIANSEKPGFIPPADKTSLVTEYAAVLGISVGNTGIERGEQIFRFIDGSVIFLFGGKDGSVGWLLVQKLDKKYVWPDRPRFTQDDAVRFCEALQDVPIWRDIKFCDLWNRREQFDIISLEEGIVQQWNYGRIICIGDSVNKMTPNLAQGANTAMEQAAGLANALYKIAKKGQQTKKPSESEVSNALGEVAKKHFAHINTINQGSYFLTRMHSRQGWANTFYGRYIYPRTAWGVVPYLAWLFSDSVAIDYLPLPAKPIGKGTGHAVSIVGAS
ncbi:FAD-dependent oxidoreductase [Aspergillus ruber CBS 135680]|uniref:Putative FAD-dependent monooxygenase n=1 Tax=Aspergillus ruber (strain CBS 135680) TaxID=1388766 RepID=A0A017SB11_ASPRC|nr:putative FAD-dependent monooxygenase [Aspergillus ruber CBS 135680]EYE93395.1 putative FAD-dependent monooxygenase [Aspergillus ruber CBS 135680]